ncbi:hypothetical protein B0T25DRAFT_515893 [Lasiosphaeria hispida]|uniref:Heterokaryon incompatibility domain-containing protein n=1 Tax=Lasiosphaeria hispida TaxID=260671 RepID=A0AAJ0HSS4_9PEZI|nr:hypothetical protein B0T25DRAFT_515893 [Lasiosphaeria hispida]
MRLLNTDTLEVETIIGQPTSKYAILSHTWDGEELTLQALESGGAGHTKAYRKVADFCRIARANGFRHAWIDTCCIDKTSSAELSEAINSMFQWYREAAVCYTYLADLNSGDDLHLHAALPSCRWFSRGWTLQELLAPKEVHFYDCGWNHRGTKASLTPLLSDITAVRIPALVNSEELYYLPAAEKMSWASRRTTTRVEDMAYCLLGIFDVNMALMYGEGPKAYRRLQEEVMRKTNDMSLLAWIPMAAGGELREIWARSPDEFSWIVAKRATLNVTSQWNTELEITSKGLRVSTLLLEEERAEDERPRVSAPPYHADILDLGCNLSTGLDIAKATDIGIRLRKFGPSLYIRDVDGPPCTQLVLPDKLPQMRFYREFRNYDAEYKQRICDIHFPWHAQFSSPPRAVHGNVWNCANRTLMVGWDTPRHWEAILVDASPLGEILVVCYHLTQDPWVLLVDAKDSLGQRILDSGRNRFDQTDEQSRPGGSRITGAGEVEVVIERLFECRHFDGAATAWSTLTLSRSRSTIDPSDLEDMIALAAGIERDELEEFLQISQSIEDSPPEQLSILSLALYTKTNDMTHLDEALFRAEEAVSAAAAVLSSGQDDKGDQGGSTPRLLGVTIARNPKSFLRATQLRLANILRLALEARFDVGSLGVIASDPELIHEACNNAVAAHIGNKAIAHLLLSHGADVEAEDSDGDIALHTAAGHGSDSVALELLERGVNPVICGGSGLTPMQWALNKGHKKMVQVLLQKNAYPDLADDCRVPLDQIPGGDILRQIELAQEIVFPASSILARMDRMRFVVRAGEGSKHDLELIEPGPGGMLAEPYVAISYCWGRTRKKEDPLTIQVLHREGKPGTTKVRDARASRDVLLRSLEYAEAKGLKRIWIDQECIHQDDEADKRDALQNMHLRQAKTTDLKSRVMADLWFTRAWGFSHREIGGFSFEQKDHFKREGRASESVQFATAGGDDILYTLADEGIEGMFRFGMSSPDGATPSPKEPSTFHARQELSPKLQMSIQGALLVQQFKACTVFSDKLAILGNLTGYPYRIHPGEAVEKKLGFSACVLAMALFNGDLGALFSNDFAFTRGGVKAPSGLLLGETSLGKLVNERSAHSRNRGRIMAGSPCLVLEGRLLVKAVLWLIVPFTLDGLEKEIASPEKGVNVGSKKDPVRFHFFQALARRLIALGRMDILELVVTSVMRRQLASPLELVHLLNELQAWFRNERSWPMGIADETFLERHPPLKGVKVVFPNGKKRKVREWVRDPNARGMDIAIARMELESGDNSDTEPEDILSHIHHAVMRGQPIALGECEVKGETLVSIFTLNPCQRQWVLTPLDELDYEFGQNAWLHMFPKDTFWRAVVYHGSLVPKVVKTRSPHNWRGWFVVGNNP